PPFTTSAADQPAVGWTYAAVVGGAIVSLIAVVVAGVPMAIAIARTAVERRRWRNLGLLAVPPISLAVWVALTALLIALGDPPAGDPWRIVIFLVWVGVFIVAALASTVAVSAAALDAEVDGSLYRRATTPALVTAVAMAVVAAAVVLWGAALAVASPAAFWGSDGILGSSTPLTWLGVVAVMVAATCFAVRAAIRARSDRAT
ncbi:MAG TPA: hypothetical protein VHM48_13745, partial [Candidatus Limnocylindrales bacterium]|nr:hypothetical protein [Candidatus Limnocylindrales bacterium]